MRLPALTEAYAKFERQDMATGTGLGERHGREWLASEPSKLLACVVAPAALKYAKAPLTEELRSCACREQVFVPLVECC